MANLEVPTRKDLPAYNYVVTLDGAQYRLDLTYNSRMGKWFVQVSDAQGNPFICPVPIVATWPLLKRFKIDSLPPGVLFPFDSSGQNEDPGRFDLGDRVRLIYQEENT